MKVYSVVVVLSKAGDQVPSIELLDIVGNADKFPSVQIAETELNIGVTFGLTVIVNLAVVAH